MPGDTTAHTTAPINRGIPSRGRTITQAMEIVVIERPAVIGIAASIIPDRTNRANGGSTLANSPKTPKIRNRPVIIIKKPPPRMIHVRSACPCRAASNMASAVNVPVLSNSMVSPTLVEYGSNVSPACLATMFRREVIQNGIGERYSGLHDHWSGNIGQNMKNNNSGIRRSQGCRSLNELLLSYYENLRTRHA